MNHQLHCYGNFQLWCRSWHGMGDLDIMEFDKMESDISNLMAQLTLRGFVYSLAAPMNQCQLMQATDC